MIDQAGAISTCLYFMHAMNIFENIHCIAS